MDDHYQYEAYGKLVSSFTPLADALEGELHLIAEELIKKFIETEEQLREKYFESGGRYGLNEEGFLKWKEYHVSGFFVNDPQSEGYIHKW